jgi:hypothetical protein
VASPLKADFNEVDKWIGNMLVGETMEAKEIKMFCSSVFSLNIED